MSYHFIDTSTFTNQIKRLNLHTNQEFAHVILWRQWKCRLQNEKPDQETQKMQTWKHLLCHSIEAITIFTMKYYKMRNQRLMNKMQINSIITLLGWGPSTEESLAVRWPLCRLAESRGPVALGFRREDPRATPNEPLGMTSPRPHQPWKKLQFLKRERHQMQDTNWWVMLIRGHEDFVYRYVQVPKHIQHSFGDPCTSSNKLPSEFGYGA